MESLSNNISKGNKEGNVDKVIKNPWAGLSSYQDPDKTHKALLFCGRNDESYDVAQLITNNIFVTLYGKSGIGKTSLLNAGVFPRLRKKHFIPVNIRLSMDADGMTFQECIIDKILSSVSECGYDKTIDVVSPLHDNQQPEFLWNFFARKRFVDKEGAVVFPVIVLDQFEEVLRKRKDESEALLCQIHYLMDEIHALSDRMVGDILYKYDFNFRFVVSIREDDLYRLEDSIDNNYLVEMKRCRFRLCSLTEQGAYDVILLPGRECLDVDNQEQIVRTIIQSSRNMEDNSINTHLLSLLCFRIFESYKRKAESRISLDLVKRFISRNPFEQFYKEVTTGLSEKEKSYIENNLIDSTGRRDSVLESEFVNNIKNSEMLLSGPTKILQRTSVSSNSNNCRIELIHDSFCEPVMKQRDKRMQRRRFFQMMMILACLCLVLAGAAWIINFMMERHQKMLENQSRFIGEKVSALVDQGDSYLGRVLALEVLPENVEDSNRPYTTEAERALRKANMHNSFVLNGHTGFVTSFAYCPVNNLIASSSYDKTVKIWDADTGAEVCSLSGHANVVTAVEFTPDGKYVVSGSLDQTVKIWSIEEQRLVGTLVDSGSPYVSGISCLAISKDGKYLVTGNERGMVSLWNLENKQRGDAFRITDGLKSVLISPDNRYVVLASKEHSIKILDIDKREVVDSLSEHTDGVNSLAFSADYRYLVSTSSDKTIKVWDFSKRKLFKSLDTGKWVEYASFSPDNQYLVAVSGDEMVRIWDIDKECVVDSLKGHTRRITKAMFCMDGKKIVSSSWDYTVRAWDNPTIPNLNIWRAHTDVVTSVAWHGDLIASASADKRILLWDSRTGEVTDSLTGHQGYVSHVAISRDGQKLVSASWDKTIKIWDLVQKKDSYTLGEHDDYVESASFSPDGKRIVSASWDKTVRIWNLEKNEDVKILKGHSNLVTFAVYSPDGKVIASCSNDSTLILWDAVCMDSLHVLKGHIGAVNACAFSPDSRKIASVSSDQTIGIWDVERGENCSYLKGHTGEITSVCFSKDGRYLLSSSNDGTIKVWDIVREEIVHSLERHSMHGVNIALFGKDDRTILSGEQDKTIRISDFPPIQELIYKTKERFGSRRLSEEERKRFYLDVNK